MADKKNRQGADHSGRTTTLLFVLAGALLLWGTMGSSRAALTYFSDHYAARMSIQDIGVTLVENGLDVSWRNYTGSNDEWRAKTGVLLSHLPQKEPGGAKAGATGVIPGQKYREELTVKNSGNIDQYVRVMLYRYWQDGEGKKTDVSPDLIQLHLLEGSGWAEDRQASTPERTVLYYTKVLPAGSTAELFSDTIALEAAIANQVTQEREERPEGTIIRTASPYDGLAFCLEAEVDAVQTHSARTAIKSAWGVDVEIAADGTLSLKSGRRQE